MNAYDKFNATHTAYAAAMQDANYISTPHTHQLECDAARATLRRDAAVWRANRNRAARYAAAATKYLRRAAALAQDNAAAAAKCANLTDAAYAAANANYDANTAVFWANWAYNAARNAAAIGAATKRQTAYAKRRHTRAAAYAQEIAQLRACVENAAAAAYNATLTYTTADAAIHRRTAAALTIDALDTAARAAALA